MIMDTIDFCKMCIRDRNYSILMDLKLILMTPKVLLMKESTDGFEEGLWEDPALKE